MTRVPPGTYEFQRFTEFGGGFTLSRPATGSFEVDAFANHSTKLKPA